MPLHDDPPSGARESPPGAALSDEDFAQITALLKDRIGLYLPPGKKPLLAARLAERMRALNLSSYAEYHQHVLYNADGELARMTDAVCTNETRFFRDTEQIEYLEKVVLPGWVLGSTRDHAPRRVRVWSAGCSTGEEAFTIAMLLLAKLPADRFSVEVLGTDISGAALERARAARWPASRLQEIPEPYRVRFFHDKRSAGEFEPVPDLRGVVRFQRLNLWDAFYPPMGRYDLILCRNVFIYFDTPTRAVVARRLLERLAPRGLLFLGMTESALALRDGSMSPAEGPRGAEAPIHLRSVGPAVYARGKARAAVGRGYDGPDPPRPRRTTGPPPPRPTLSARSGATP